MLLKVGALAKQTGLTVRTLHHYDEIGLLAPSHRSETGYRMYNRDDVVRLHQIQALKQLGFGLAEIGETLASDGAALRDIVTQQLAALDQQIEQSARLRAQLLRLKAKMDQGDKPEMADWLITLELMTMYGKYFTPDELQALDKHRKNASSDLNTRWPEIVKAMRDLMDRNIDPSHADAQTLIAEWTALAQETVGNDAGLLHKLDAMTRNEPTMQAQTGIDPVLLGYVVECIKARHTTIYAKYLTPDALRRVMQGRVKTGTQWPPLIAAMRKLIEKGADVTDPEVRELAVQWKALFDATYDGDGEHLKEKLGAAYKQEPELLRGTGLDLPMLAFVRRAMATL